MRVPPDRLPGIAQSNAADSGANPARKILIPTSWPENLGFPSCLTFSARPGAPNVMP